MLSQCPLHGDRVTSRSAYDNRGRSLALDRDTMRKQAAEQCWPPPQLESSSVVPGRRSASRGPTGNYSTEIAFTAGYSLRELLFDPASQTVIFGTTSQRLEYRYHRVVTTYPVPAVIMKCFNPIVKPFRESNKTAKPNETFRQGCQGGEEKPGGQAQGRSK